MDKNLFLSSLRDITLVAPELPEQAAFDTLERIETYERALILPANELPRDLLNADYSEGSATFDNEVRTFGVDNFGLLVNADHATAPIRVATGRREGPDAGTGALAVMLSQEEVATALVPVGRQTGNASVDDDYPIKYKMAELLPDRNGFLSLHGMRPGKILHEDDQAEIHALIGLGSTPTEKTRAVAEKLLVAASDLGLRAIISNDHKHMERLASDNGNLLLGDDNQPLRKHLAALKETTTTNYARRFFENIQHDKPSFQIELTRGIRLVPSDFEHGWFVDRKAKAMGVYAGYLLCSRAAELILESNQPRL